MLFFYYFETVLSWHIFFLTCYINYCSQIAVTEDQKIFHWGRSPHFFRFYMVSIVLIISYQKIHVPCTFPAPPPPKKKAFP